MLRNYNMIYNPDDIGGVLQTLESSPSIAIDLETTGLDYVMDSIHGIALANEEQEWYITHQAKDAMLPHLADVLNPHPKVYMHNGKFDLHFMERFGVRPDSTFDTYMGQWLLDENQDLGLKDLGGTKLGFGDLPDFKDLMHLAKKLTGKKKLEDVNIFDMPLHLVAEYAGKDARLTYMLGQLTEYELYKANMMKFFTDVEMPFMFLVMDMESNGFSIEIPFFENLLKEFTEKQEESLYNFHNIVGSDVDIGSSKQLGELLYGEMGFPVTRLTDTKKPSTDVIALMRLIPEDETGVVQSVLDYRKYDKLLQTYVTSYLNNVHPDGRLRANFNPVGTVTGRISSSKPTNLMNIPARGDEGSQIRKGFITLPGNIFICIDYSQLELRLAGHYTKDENLIRTFLEGGDPHQLTADLCGVLRWVGKTLNFGVLYGSGPRSLCNTVEKNGNPRPTEAEAKDWLTRFDRAYPTITNWKARVIRYAGQLGHVKTISGRLRRLPDIQSQDYGIRGRAERQAVNSVIQGSAADIIQLAMLNVMPLVDEVGGMMLAQVHDELCFEVPVEAEEYFKIEASRIMVEAGEHFGIIVPLEAEPGSGRSWGESKV